MNKTEIEQPASSFLLRLKQQDGKVPQCALFETDGGTWKLHAANFIKQWFEWKVSDKYPVIL